MRFSSGTLAAQACQALPAAARPETPQTNELRRWLRAKARHWRPDFAALASKSLDRRAGRTFAAEPAATPELQHLARLVDKYSKPIVQAANLASSGNHNPGGLVSGVLAAAAFVLVEKHSRATLKLKHKGVWLLDAMLKTINGLGPVPVPLARWAKIGHQLDRQLEAEILREIAQGRTA